MLEGQKSPVKSIKIIKNKKRKPALVNDPKKESIFKELADLAEFHGYAVKRENLKQGIGWKAMSGICRFNEDRLIYVDKKLPQGDQISFLLNTYLNLGLKPNQQQIDSLSEETRSLFSGIV